MCFHFMYYIFGDGDETLAVYLGESEEAWLSLWSRSYDPEGMSSSYIPWSWAAIDVVSHNKDMVKSITLDEKWKDIYNCHMANVYIIKHRVPKFRMVGYMKNLHQTCVVKQNLILITLHCFTVY